MSLFNQLVSEALRSQGNLAPLRPVVEKELLHHDILREMSTAGLLKNLTFIGGTCLRACHGSNRLSEDLEFTGGNNFEVNELSLLARTLTEGLNQKYGLQVDVSEPKKTSGNVDTWKLQMTTRPKQKNLPAQRIHIDICAIPSYDRQPMVLRNFYGVEMGTSGLIIQAQSRQEILADKMVAFTLRPNRIKNRDLWDIGWLKQQNIALPLELVKKKIKNHNSNSDDFLELLAMRNNEIENDPQIHQSLIHEMRRFLPPDIVGQTIANEDFWTYLKTTVRGESDLIMDSIGETK